MTEKRSDGKIPAFRSDRMRMKYGRIALQHWWRKIWWQTWTGVKPWRLVCRIWQTGNELLSGGRRKSGACSGWSWEIWKTGCGSGSGSGLWRVPSGLPAADSKGRSACRTVSADRAVSYRRRKTSFCVEEERRWAEKLSEPKPAGISSGQSGNPLWYHAGNPGLGCGSEGWDGDHRFKSGRKSFCLQDKQRAEAGCGGALQPWRDL